LIREYLSQEVLNFRSILDDEDPAYFFRQVPMPSVPQ